jgi:hypothetical protein
MFKVETDCDGCVTDLRVIGRLQSDRIACIRKVMNDGNARKIFDLSEVTLVDLGVIRFLMGCEDEGIKLSQCPPWVREWMTRERAEGP